MTLSDKEIKKWILSHKIISIGLIVLIFLIIVFVFTNSFPLSTNSSSNQTPLLNNTLAITGQIIQSNPSIMTSSKVISVTDGDTIVLENEERVRLLSINSVEKGQRCWEEAKTRLEQLILNKTVRLESDFDNLDKYRRSLRFIFIDNKNVNVLMVREGLASVYIVGSNKKYLSELEAAERQAKEEGGCIWQKSFSCKDCIGIAYFLYDAEGNDCNNPNDEYVKFSNTCNQECDMTSWTVKDEGTSTYTFPNFIIQANSLITLKSGWGKDTTEELFWKNSGTSSSCPAIWNNDKDTLFLKDKTGLLVLEYGY